MQRLRLRHVAREAGARERVEAEAAGLLEALVPKLGSMKCVAIRPSIAPPRVSRIALRSSTYATAWRTASLSNGALRVFSAM